MKKVLFMLGSMNIGGVEKSFLSLLSVLPKEKYDITLLLLEKKGRIYGTYPRLDKGGGSFMVQTNKTNDYAITSKDNKRLLLKRKLL